MRTALDRANNVAVSKPNWSRPAREIIEFKTGVFEAWNGQEWRHAERQSARMSFAYQSEAFTSLRVATIDDLTTQLEDKSFAVACSWRYVRLTADLPAASGSITVDVDAPWWVQEGATLILESEEQTEAVLVSSVTTGVETMTITLDAATVNAYATGDKVILGVMSHYPKEASLTALVSGHLRTVPEFLADPAQLPPWQLQATTRPIHFGYEVLPIRHNWADRLAARHDDRRTVVDYGVGIRSLEWEKDVPMQVENRQHVALNREKADQLVHDFIRHKGMLTPFWTGSLMHRLPQGMVGTAGQDQVSHPDQDAFYPAYVDRPQFSHVYIEWPDGAVQLSEIENMVSSGLGDRINIADNLERDVDSQTLVTFAVLARFGADRLEIDWTTDSVATARIPIKILDPRVLDENVVQYSGSPLQNLAQPADWSDPTEYTEIDLVAAGVSTQAIDSFDVRFETAFYATTAATPPNTWELRLEWAFYDESMVELATDSGFSPGFKSNDGDIKAFGRQDTGTVPANTRFIRYRMTLTRDFDNLTARYFDILGPERGTNQQSGNLQWI